MLRNTYLNENRMITNKVKCSIVWGVKEKYSVWEHYLKVYLMQ